MSDLERSAVKRFRAVADTDTSIELVARHEAGHAVMAIAMGYTVNCVWVRPDGTGFVRAGPGRGRRRDPFAEAMICWAGCIADKTYDSKISAGDAHIMLRLRYRWSSILALREMALQRFKDWNLEPAVVAVAALLVSEVGRRVNGRAVHDTALRAVPSLLPRRDRVDVNLAEGGGLTWTARQARSRSASPRRARASTTSNPGIIRNWQGTTDTLIGKDNTVDVMQIIVNGQLAGQVPLALGTSVQLQVVRVPDPPAPPPAAAEPQGGGAEAKPAPQDTPKPPTGAPKRRAPPK